MEEYFKEHNQYPPRIVTTGHSLGGALATIAAAHIAFTYKEYREKHAEHTEYTQWRLQTTHLLRRAWAMMACAATSSTRWATVRCR